MTSHSWVGSRGEVLMYFERHEMIPRRWCSCKCKHPGESPTYIPSKGYNLEHARTISCVKLSINNHIVGLVHKNHIMRTRLMYHAACKVEFQPLTVVLTADVFQLFIKTCIKTCMMYHAACKVEFQPFKRSYTQLTFFNFL